MLRRHSLRRIRQGESRSLPFGHLWYRIHQLASMDGHQPALDDGRADMTLAPCRRLRQEWIQGRLSVVFSGLRINPIRPLELPT